MQSARETGPTPSNRLREEIQAKLVAAEDGISAWAAMWPIQSQILQGESIGSDISDYIFLQDIFSFEEFVQKESMLKELEQKINNHIGEEILVFHEDRFAPTGGRIREWWLSSLEGSNFRLERSSRVSANIALGKTRYPDLQLMTNSYVRKSSWPTPNGERIELETGNLPLYKFARVVLVGTEEINSWREQSVDNQTVYAEMSSLLQTQAA